MRWRDKDTPKDMPRQYSTALVTAVIPMEQLKSSFLCFMWESRLTVGFQIHRKRGKAIKREAFLKEKKETDKGLWFPNFSPLLVSRAPVTPTAGHILGFHQQWDTKSVPVTSLSPGGEQWLLQSCLSWERAWKWRSWIYVQGFKITVRGTRGNSSFLLLETS